MDCGWRSQRLGEQQRHQIGRSGLESSDTLAFGQAAGYRFDACNQPERRQPLPPSQKVVPRDECGENRSHSNSASRGLTFFVH